jgi:ADP-ribose pyrophosphatase YjhB (NUDIX family)
MAEARKKPGGLQRPAAGILAQLLKAKGESDRKNYPAKHDLLRRLIKESPGEFRIDSEEGGIYGLTHAPTGFKIHMPRAAAPPELRANERYVRVDVGDAKGKKLLHHFIRDNKWGSPAGRIEEGEDPAQAAVRELLERTGYEGAPADLSPRGIDDGTHVYSVALEKLKQVAKPGERGGYSTKIKLAADGLNIGKLFIERDKDAPGMPDQKVAVASALNAIIEKQAQPTFSRLQMPGGNQTMRHLFQGVGGPIEQGVELFDSPSDYLDEMMTIPYVGETPLYSDKKSLWDNIKNLLMRPINRRERLRNEREHLVRTQWAVQSLGGHQVGAPSRGFPGLPGRGTLNYGQQSFQQAQARNLPFIAQLILNEPGGYRMVRDTGKASTWLHMGSGYQFTVPNKPDPKDLLNIHVEPPKQDLWASALRWRQGRATPADLKRFKLDKASRQTAAQKLLERQKAAPPILNEGT